MRFLFVDRIIESSPGQWIRGIKHITADDSCLTTDIHGNFCFISSLIGETLGQLAAWNVMAACDYTARPVAGVVASARVCRPAFVGETLLLESFIDHLDEGAVQYHSIARVGDEPVFIIDGALGPLLPMRDFINDDEIRQQYAEIFRPGDWAATCQLSMQHKKSMAVSTAPIQPLYLNFDRITASLPGESISAEKCVSRAAPYLPDHFPKKPVLPMTVLLECIQNLTAQFMRDALFTIDYQLSELRKIKMNDFVQPGDVIGCHMKVKLRDDETLILACRCDVAGKRVCVVEVVLKAKGKSS